jgi:hypothetical protein
MFMEQPDILQTLRHTLTAESSHISATAPTHVRVMQFCPYKKLQNIYKIHCIHKFVPNYILNKHSKSYHIYTYFAGVGGWPEAFLLYTVQYVPSFNIPGKAVSVYLLLFLMGKKVLFYYICEPGTSHRNI